ncbi:unnamed protein product [Symbiodinium microadriaticum]|nr:unnamed protein product [Symbiodinium microadriaticum]
MALLAVIFEMSMYVLYLRSSPARFAALLIDPKGDLQTAKLQDELMKDMKKEWETIVQMENTESSNQLLQQRCSFTRWVCYREPMTCLELERWSMTDKAKALLLSWHPGLAFSANVEQVFAAVEDSSRRAVKNFKASMANLQCLSIRAVEQKVAASDTQEEAGNTDRARAIKLGVEDFEGNEVRYRNLGDHFSLDNILKGYQSTSSYHHNKVELNWLKGLSGLDPEESSSRFWVPSLCQPGMLLRVADKFYVVLGSTPAVLYALQMDEIGLMFKGRLPVYEVEVFSYTIHFVGPRLCDKLGCAAVLRRCEAGQKLLVWMIRSKDIVKVTSESLSQWAAQYGLQIRRNSTKSAKIRALCQLPDVTAACTPAELKALDDLLNEIDEKRRKRTKASEAENQEEDEADLMEEEEDETMAAARQLLEQVQRQEDEDDADAEGMKPDEAAAAAAAVPVPAEEPAAEAPEADERKRASRRLLSSCQAVPGFLTEKFKMRDDVVVSHVEHRSNVLPHFQVRLPGDEKYEGKPRGCRNSSCGLITNADSNSFCNMSG